MKVGQENNILQSRVSREEYGHSPRWASLCWICYFEWNRKVSPLLLYPFHFWKAAQIVPSRVEVKLLMSRSQRAFSLVCWMRKEENCLYSAVLCFFYLSQRSRKERGQKSERDGVYPSTKSQRSACTQRWQSNVVIAPLRQIVSSLGGDTLITVLLPEGTHTCKALCKI